MRLDRGKTWKLAEDGSESPGVTKTTTTLAPTMSVKIVRETNPKRDTRRRKKARQRVLKRRRRLENRRTHFNDESQALLKNEYVEKYLKCNNATDGSTVRVKNRLAMTETAAKREKARTATMSEAKKEAIKAADVVKDVANMERKEWRKARDKR